MFGTRPEIIKCIPVLLELRAHADIESVVCVTGQHREMLDQMLPLCDLQPDIDLNLMQPNQSLHELTARTMQKMGEVMAQVKPDRVLVQGDTATAYTAALAAFYAGVPVGHIEAGLRSYDLYAPWPEEFNRRAISIFADMHFTPTSKASACLRHEAVADGRIIETGNTVIDALQLFVQKVRDNEAIARDFAMLDVRKKLVLVTAHRRENFDGGIESICSALKELAARGDVQIVFPVHLNPNVKAPVEAMLAEAADIYLLPPQDYLHFLYLMDRAYVILSDSGGVQEEAPFLQKPVLVLRDTTERPEGIEAGVTKLVGTDAHTIVAEATALLDDEAAYAAMQGAQTLYGDGHAAARIVAAIRDKHAIQEEQRHVG